jgi:hypothetical protein
MTQKQAADRLVESTIEKMIFERTTFSDEDILTECVKMVAESLSRTQFITHIPHESQ